MNMRPIRLGMRQADDGRWHLEVALPARKDGVVDAEDIVERVGNATFPTEDDALAALAYVLTFILDDPRHG
jgi:hypothetical protein